MTRKPDTYEVRLTSRRAPYRRAGVAFASTRTPVVIPADDLTDDQLIRLSADPQIGIEVIDIATGDVVAFQTEDGTAIGIGPAISAEGEETGADGRETVASSEGAAGGQAAAPVAAAEGHGGGQTGAGSVSPAPATPPVETPPAPAAPAPETPKPTKPAKPARKTA